MDEETRAEIRELHKRERIRSWISVLFVLAIVAGYRPITMLACVLWVGYLAYCIRRGADRGVRITNWIVMALPVGVFIFNLVMLIKG